MWSNTFGPIAGAGAKGVAIDVWVAGEPTLTPLLDQVHLVQNKESYYPISWFKPPLYRSVGDVFIKCVNYLMQTRLNVGLLVLT